MLRWLHGWFLGRDVLRRETWGFHKEIVRHSLVDNCGYRHEPTHVVLAIGIETPALLVWNELLCL